MSDKAEKNKVKEKKKKDPQNIIVISGISLLGIVLIISVVFALDVFGIKSSIKHMIVNGLLVEQIKTIESELGERYDLMLYESLEEEKALIASQKSETAKTKAELDLLSRELEEKTKTVEEMHENTLKAQENMFGIQNDITELSRIYSNMDVARAAQILSVIEDRVFAAAILFNMKQGETAQILSQMDIDDAVLLTKARYENGVITEENDSEGR